MRGRDAVAVALRHPDGSIVTATEGLDSPLHRSRYGRMPLLRGLVVLYDTLYVELADREGVPMVTFDEKILKVYPSIAKRPRDLE